MGFGSSITLAPCRGRSVAPSPAAAALKQLMRSSATRSASEKLSRLGSQPHVQEMQMQPSNDPCSLYHDADSPLEGWSSWSGGRRDLDMGDTEMDMPPTRSCWASTPCV